MKLMKIKVTKEKDGAYEDFYDLVFPLMPSGSNMLGIEKFENHLDCAAAIASLKKVERNIPFLIQRIQKRMKNVPER